MNTNWMFFKSLKNRVVTREDHDKTGSLEDAVVDLQTGRLAFYTMGSGGFLGMGEDKVAIPPQALHFTKEEVRLAVSPEAVEHSPGAGGKWPEQVDSSFVDEVYRHYGYAPYTR